MTTLDEIVNLENLQRHLEAGNIKATCHPFEPLTIYNYTQRVQYGHLWDNETTACRGLIVDDAGQVIARPFRKFFNYGEVDTAPTGPVQVTDKADGSLAILFPAADGWAIATRGSFTSEQAVRATQILRARYSDFEPLDGYTYLFEIIYPENRVVVDYGRTADLFLITAVHIETGRSVPRLELGALGWPGPCVESFTFPSLTEALASPPRPGAEGLVIHFTESDERLKIKQEDYKRLHRLIFGVSSKTIYEALRNGDSFDDLLDRVPDEFYDWVQATVADLRAERDRIELEGRVLYATARSFVTAETGLTPDDPGFPKAFALALDQTNPLHSIAFTLRAGKTPDYWRYVEPARSLPFANRSEDAD